MASAIWMALSSGGGAVHNLSLCCLRTPQLFVRNVFHIRVLKERVMLWTVFVVLLILWLLGFSLHIGGGLIHLLLVIGLVVLVFNLMSGRRAV